MSSERPAELFFQASNVFLVVGASENPEKYGSKVFLDLKSAGYNVVAINHNVAEGGEIHGTPAYPSVTEFLERVERLFDRKRRDETLGKIVLVLVIPPKAALAVVEEAAAHGIRKAWFQPGAESPDAITFCGKNGVASIHGQCIMVRRPRA